MIDILCSLATFSAFHWSPDSTRLLFVAEKKLPKCEPFYKQKSKSKAKTDKPNDEEEPSRVKRNIINIFILTNVSLFFYK